MQKLYIFDLDGTLYHENDHFYYYASCLKEDVPNHLKTAFDNDYEKMLAGNHPVKIGTVYDVAEDLILAVDPFSWQVTAVRNWSGEVLENGEEQYPEPIQPDFKRFIAVGDGWWLPFVCAKHFGVDDCYPHYLRTKDFMTGEHFNIRRIPGLAEKLAQLREQAHLVLMTNSDPADTERLLQTLGLTHTFAEKITNAEKPSKTLSQYHECLTRYQTAPESAFAVGDNFMNDIAPAIQLGMHSVLIQDTPAVTEFPGLTHVAHIRDWI